MQFDGKAFLAVIVLGSDRRPHFAGPAFVRDGAKTIAASEQQFAQLIAQRNSAAYEILQWKGKMISIWHPSRGHREFTYHPKTGYTAEGFVKDCNQFYVTIDDSAFGGRVSFGLEAFEIGFDHLKNRLELRFRAPFG
jgi:hypothetical protein